MTSIVRKVKLGALELPIHAALELQQRIEPVDATELTRLSDGTLISQTAWSGKRRVVLSGTGVIPIGIGSLDYTAPITFSSAQQEGVTSTSRVITIPSTRRTDGDYVPYGRALLGDTWQDTAVSLVSDEATLTLVTGATHYQCVFFRQFSAYFTPPTQGRGRGNRFTWDLIGEEI